MVITEYLPPRPELIVHPSTKHRHDFVLTVPVVHEALAPIMTVIPLQLLAYYIAMLRGCDVDQPRNLAKSVTVE